ncbi:MAG: anti-sigma factor family protein [Thermoanaerobaculaceae bacterium]
MTCEELRALMELEGTAESEAAREHLVACRACAREVELWQEVRAELRDMGREPAPPFLHARIMAHVRAEAPAARARTWLRGWRAPALAAVGAAVVILGLGLFRAVKPPAATPVEELVGTAEKRAVAEPASPRDKGGARLPAPAAPAPTPATLSTSAGLDERAARENEAAGGTVPAAKDDLALVAKAGPAARETAPAGTGAAHAEMDAAAAGPVVAQAAARRESGSLAASAPGAQGNAPVAGTLRAAEPKREAAEVVRCRLQLEGDGEVLDLELPAAEAPPPEEVWSVTVAPDGRIEVLDAHGRTQQAPAALQQGLSQQQQRQQQLRLGRYRLSQAPAQATPAP